MAIVARGFFRLTELVGTAAWEVLKLAVTVLDIVVQVVINVVGSV